MEVKQIIAELEGEISRLKEARALLAGEAASPRRGRPAGRPSAPKKAGGRRMSAAGRRRIAEAMRRRWAERRKAAKKAAK